MNVEVPPGGALVVLAPLQWGCHSYSWLTTWKWSQHRASGEREARCVSASSRYASLPVWPPGERRMTLHPVVGRTREGMWARMRRTWAQDHYLHPCSHTLRRERERELSVCWFNFRDTYNVFTSQNCFLL